MKDAPWVEPCGTLKSIVFCTEYLPLMHTLKCLGLR